MIEIIYGTHPFTPPTEGISGNHFLNYMVNFKCQSIINPASSIPPEA